MTLFGLMAEIILMGIFIEIFMDILHVRVSVCFNYLQDKMYEKQEKIRMSSLCS